MSDLVQFVLDSVKGSRVVASGGARSLRSSARRARNRMSSDEFDEKTKKEIDRPYGLAQGGNNWLEDHKISESIKFGLIDQKDIINDFKKMLVRVDGSRSPLLVNEAGELKTFPNKYRWNSEYNYSWIVGQHALDEVKGLKKVTHLILTFDPDIVKQIIPDW